MTAASERLWWLNNGYRTRLSRAEKSLGLLETLLRDRASPADGELARLLALLRDLRRVLMRLSDDQRDWRYSYYYQSVQRKRMVVAESDVHRALVHFRRMRARHERTLAEALSPFAGVRRPGEALTLVALADLWLHAEQALDDLLVFIDAAAD